MDDELTADIQAAPDEPLPTLADAVRAATPPGRCTCRVGDQAERLSCWWHGTPMETIELPPETT